jgi:ABC-type antimicrobial peptide transport system permease subunit
MPLHVRLGWSIKEWDDKPENAEAIKIGIINISEDFLSYYEIKPLEGELVNNNDNNKNVLINESAVKAFGWHNAVGKNFKFYDGHVCTVKGVIKNIYNMSPTIAAQPIFYTLENPDSPVKAFPLPVVLFKFNDGEWQTCRKKIEEIVKSEFPNIKYNICSAENEYDKFLKSENTLLKILSLVSLVCVIVCVFGFVSIVALTCEERRKEIAIRKIHGATIKDILDIFFKEYLLLLIVGALVAFPAGYLIMKPWLENYVLQTEISAWIYATILLALIMAIVFCVGRKVYRTSRENPAETVKKF